MNDYKFGNFICALREKKGLTQAEVAAMLKVTPAAVSKWETGASKPRVEILFKLAEILEVKPEELMAGQYIPEERFDAQSIKEINERYEYLVKIESHESFGVKIRRVAAAVIDWNLIGLAVIALAACVAFIRYYFNIHEALFFVMFFGLVMSYPICFTLRDLIFKGRSLGKRIMGLVIIDKRTAGKARVWQTLVRDLFMVAMEPDLVIMLIKGQSIGDMVAGTLVVSKKHLEEHSNMSFTPDTINSYSDHEKKRRKKIVKSIILIIVGVAVSFSVFIAAVFAIVFGILESTKSSEEYKIAEEYLVNSQSFKELDAELDDVRFNSYKSNVSGGEATAVMGFTVKGRHFAVVTHKYDNQWFVCDECTDFE